MIQPFQQEQRAVGFFWSYRQIYPVSRQVLRDIATAAAQFDQHGRALAAAAEAIMSPAADARGPVEYRKHVGGIMVMRALQRAASRAR